MQNPTIASKFKGAVDILNSKHNLGHEKNLICDGLGFVQGQEREVKVNTVVLC